MTEFRMTIDKMGWYVLGEEKKIGLRTQYYEILSFFFTLGDRQAVKVMLLLQFKADEGVENCKEMEHFKCMTTNF